MSFQQIHANKLLAINGRYTIHCTNIRWTHWQETERNRCCFTSKYRKRDSPLTFLRHYFFFILFVLSSLTDFKGQWWWTLKHFSCICLRLNEIKHWNRWFKHQKSICDAQKLTMANQLTTIRIYFLGSNWLEYFTCALFIYTCINLSLFLHLKRYHLSPSLFDKLPSLSLS